MEYRWEILWPCGAKNPGIIGLLNITSSHHPPTTPTYITFSTQLLPKTSINIKIESK
jgi:hypothetical protein